MSRSTSIQFGLLGHPADFKHMSRLLARARKDFNDEKLQKHRPFLTRLLEWTPSYVADPDLSLSNAQGATIEGKFIVCPFLPQELHTPHQMALAFQKIMQGCKLAQDLGARIVGLGGFTSIVAGGRSKRIAEEMDLAVTSGNTLTAALAVEQVLSLLKSIAWDLSEGTLAVVGATGDIGRACALALAPRARRTLLIGRNELRLRELEEEIPSFCELSLSTDVKDALNARVVVAATSAASPLFDEREIPSGTIVCDIGYPKNLSYGANRRKDVITFSGGLAVIPFAVDLGHYTLLPANNVIHGCFAEAMVLALSGSYESFSTGYGLIDENKMSHILLKARSHGFLPAPLFRGDRRLSSDDLDRFLLATERAKKSGR